LNFTVMGFRTAFPEFMNTETYPDALILGWSTVAIALVNCRLWRSQTTLGINLYIAHEITLEAQSIAAACIGGTPGGQTGVLNTKTVGSVTAGYDTQQAAEKDSGWWNLTSYGKQFIRLARIFGAGALQL
jgi:hypothetical protein